MMPRLARPIAFYASAVLVGMVLGWFLHSAPKPSESVRQAKHEVRVATKHADTAVAHERVDSAHTVIALAPLEVALAHVDVHDSASVTRVIAAATIAAPACRALVSSCSLAIAAKDSVIAAKDREIAARAALLPPRLTFAAAALYDPLARAPSARVETDVRVSEHLSLLADAERGVGPTDSLRVHVGARWRF